MTQSAEIADIVTELGLTATYNFVPFSQSRNKHEKKAPSLNWVVTILKDGIPILSCDYSSGAAHCPSYKFSDGSLSRKEAVWLECETGLPSVICAGGEARSIRGRPIEPELHDVLYSLEVESHAIDYGSFEEWAASIGFSRDSRKGESIYRTCIDVGLKLRSSLGESGLQRLREAFRDY